MKTTKTYPWDEISTPATDYNVRRVKSGGELPLYWGKDENGKILLLISLTGDNKELFSKEKIQIKGIDVDLQQNREHLHQNLVLTLEHKVNQDLFYALCTSLLQSLRSLSHADDALSVTLQHLKRWRTFLMSARPRLLSMQEYRGLFAELLFLKELLKTSLSEKTALEAWTGPDAIQQDFIFSGRAVEVKSLSSQDPSTVRISSENQLESTEKTLYLVAYTLREHNTASTPQRPTSAQSLNDLVLEISTMLQDIEVQTAFNHKLLNYGYTYLAEYNTPTLSASLYAVYAVKEDFPKLARANIPTGLVRVHYQIELDIIRPFICPFSMVLGDL